MAPTQPQIDLELSRVAPPADVAFEELQGWTREQFQQAVRPLLPRVFRLCLVLARDAAGAEDLLQNALVRAYERRESFMGRGSLLGWLCQIARREHSDLARMEARRRTLLGAIERVTEFLEGVFAAAPPDPERWVCDASETELLLDSLRDVPLTYRSVVLLCDIEELSYETVASTLGLPLGTVKSRQARGRRLLREAFERRINRLQHA